MAGCEKGSRPVADDRSGKRGIRSFREPIRVATRLLAAQRRQASDSSHSRVDFGENGFARCRTAAGRKGRPCRSAMDRASWPAMGRRDGTRGSGDRQTKWGPASLPTPTIRFHPSLAALTRFRPLLLRSAMDPEPGDVRLNDPAMVWSAPFRGPASPGTPFIILSKLLPKQPLFPSDGLRSICPIWFVSTRGNRDVP